ncbi:MAG: TIGR02221 family CRISPR-associated protein [Bacteroidaceae bacterium]|nr:TIGR02221 family CRISPR-associated protein [Bacteroidaceae bacterium]
MARKVLLSFLGTGPLEARENRTYKTADYHIDNKSLGNYPFVSAALKKYYEIDKLILVGTVRSMWEEVYRWFCIENSQSMDDDIYLSVAQTCEEANSKSDLTIPYQTDIERAIGSDSKIVLIRYGINDQEIKENTDILLGLQQYLNANDELIVDVTHSFRSLPMYMMNLLIYLKNVCSKKITISHIHYGMLEMNKELGYAPIIDLKSMMDVNDWITGAYSFSEFGNAYKISELVRTQDKSVSNLLDEFSNLMNLNHLHAIQKISQRLSSIKNKEYQTLLPMLTINPAVETFIKRFDTPTDKHALFQLKVARWQLDHRKYAQAILTVNEAMITHICEINRMKWDDYDIREGAKAALSNKLWGWTCDRVFKDIYRNLKPLRNSTAHSLETTDNVASMLKVLNESVSELEKLITQPNRGNANVSSTKGDQRILINFSNHPLENWNEKQLKAAKKYGKVKDLPFPDIDPNANEKDLQAISADYVQKIQAMAEGNNATVHIMGEMTFTFMVVSQLKEIGIQCIASTTEREAEVFPNGKKLSDFQFVRFRSY